MNEEHIVRCDENFASPLLLSHLKNYDRVVSKDTFGLFGSIHEMLDGKRYVVDETVTEIMPEIMYVRCTVKPRGSEICVKDAGFYRCNFIGVKTIVGAIMYGENTSLDERIELDKIHLLTGHILINEITLEMLNRKLESRSIVTQLVEVIQEDEVDRLTRELSVICRTFSEREALILMNGFLNEICVRILELRARVGMNVTVEIVDLAIRICQNIISES